MQTIKGLGQSRITDADRAKILKLDAQGLRCRLISERLGRSTSGVSRVIRDAKALSEKSRRT